LTVKKEAVNPPSVFRSVEHGFSQAVMASGVRTLYVSGQTAWDSQKRLVGGADLEQQARQAFANVRSVVEAAGATMADVVSLRIYIVDYRPRKPHRSAVRSGNASQATSSPLQRGLA
jgi:enamine deaminase RidA (YjgF/YER057c/UK114 family)